MNEWESYDQWKQRAFDNLQNAKNKATTTTASKTNKTYFSDIDVKYINPTTQDAKKRHQKQGVVVHKLGNKEEFDAKMQKIANDEDYEWVVAIMAIDDFSEFIFSNDNEITKMEKEMYHLFDVYGNGNFKNTMKYFGYKYKTSRDDATFGLILYDSKDTNKCFVPAHEMLETLKEEISMKCGFTVSIGSSRLIENDCAMADDWIDRIHDNLKRAQQQGKNQVCFGSGGSGGSSGDSKDDDDGHGKLNEDDLIQMESLRTIEVSCTPQTKISLHQCLCTK